MKKFILKSILFSVIFSILVCLVLFRYGGYVDYFYEKFTTPRQTSLILGDSRSFQGLQPRIINQKLQKQFELPIYNYSFTISQIGYGKPYLESIRKKLNPKTRNGIFILSVHPWLLAQRDADDFNIGYYSESGQPPHNMSLVNMNPNAEYFFRNFSYFHFRSIIRKNSFLHKDGWLEESNLPKSKAVLADWKKNQIDIYSEFAKKWSLSQQRWLDLQDIVFFLKRHGRVYLVRMPVDEEIKRIENYFDPLFDKKMSTLSKKSNSYYFNFSNNNKYSTYDGNHLDKYGGARFTSEVCDSIKVLINK